MTRHPQARWVAIGALAVVFGLVTIKEGGSVLFIDGAARRDAGHFVPFVVWMNFLAGFAYVAAGAALALGRSWAARLAVAIAAVTAVGFVAFGVHVLAGGAFERRTVFALAFRTAFWAVLAWRVTRRFSARPCCGHEAA